MPFDLEHSLELWGYFWRHPVELVQGLPYSLTLLLILLAHEFGHYVASAFHRVDASLPYFLPSPILGTFGAFIRIRSPIYSRRALFDIGIAGPLAGFVFLVPALAVGIAFSKVMPGIAHAGQPPFRRSHVAVAAASTPSSRARHRPTSTCTPWPAPPGSECLPPP